MLRINGKNSSNKDIRDHISVFVITNGRSTYDYCIKAIEESEGVCFEYDVIKDMSWIDANNEILYRCKTPYFVRVDDDMLVHPRCFQYMYHCIDKHDSNKIAMTQWELWEFYSDRSVRSIKLYNHKLTKEVGYEINHLGKIDKLFRANCNKYDYKISTFKDIIGIHSCGEVDEHLRYAKMRGEHKGKDFDKKSKFIKESISKITMPLSQQFIYRETQLAKMGKKRRSDFYYWLQLNG